jgi:cytochrome c oxidase assembly protein subunit 15
LWLYGKKARPFMRWTGLAFLALAIATGLMMPGRRANGVVSGITGLALFAASFAWPRCDPAARWLRRLGLVAFLAVVLQGVLGGLRVVLFKDQIGIFHATLAQLFFVLVCAIALFTSRWWRERNVRLHPGPAESADGRSISLPRPARNERGESWGEGPSEKKLLLSPTQPMNLPMEGTSGCDVPAREAAGGTTPGFRKFLLFATLLIFFQLILGAAMRHQHAGLAVPDFPLAYGKLWPAMDSESVARYNQHRIEVAAANPITAFQIGLHMAHRITAVLILAAVAFCAWRVPNLKPLRQLAFIWLGLILAQIALGAATVLSDKAADIATAHVLIGALALATGAISCIVSFQSPESARDASVLSGVGTGAQTNGPLAGTATAG